MLLILPIESVAQTAIRTILKNAAKYWLTCRFRSPTVTDVPAGLKKKDFFIYQNGVEQKIVSFSTFDEPINIAILLDTSGSTKNSLKEIKEAAADFIDLLNQQDKCLIATFDSQVNVLNTLTNDHKTLKNSLNQVKTDEKEGSVLFNAIKQIAQKSFVGVEGRKVIIVLSDGKDFGSSLGKTELINQLEESDVSIYSIFYQTGDGFNKLMITPDGTLKESEETQKTEGQKAEKTKKKGNIR